MLRDVELVEFFKRKKKCNSPRFRITLGDESEGLVIFCSDHRIEKSDGVKRLYRLTPTGEIMCLDGKVFEYP